MNQTEIIVTLSEINTHTAYALDEYLFYAQDEENRDLEEVRMNLIDAQERIEDILAEIE